MNALERKLLGESAREIGVLILVFVPLDVWITPRPNGREPSYPGWLAWAPLLSVDHWMTLLFTVGGLTMIYFGIKIESRSNLFPDGENGKS
jgi:hypothetical protein